MEKIIQQIALDLAKNITEYALIDGIFDVDKLSSLALVDCKRAAAKIVETIVAQQNCELRAQKAERKELGLVLKEKDRERNVLTELGSLKLNRDYYFNRNSKNYEYPIDAVIGIQPYERIGKEISAKLVREATLVSYARSSEIVTDGAVSRQSVRNKILKAPELEIIPDSAVKKTVRELHIFADEDHVHMQKPGKVKGKKNQIVPLVTVTEGIRTETGRNNTINPIRFVDTKFNTESLWENVDGFIRLKYDIENIDKIYIHGDGGKWISRGLEEYKQTEHIMDGYHLGKYLRSIDKQFKGKNARFRITAAIKEDNRDKMENIFTSLLLTADEKQKEVAEKTKNYLENNWDEIVKRKTLDIPGSCTEGQVSHVLSERFSRDPLGWSKECLGKLSKLRVYVKNNGKIEGKHFKVSRETETASTSCIEKLLKENISGSFDWSIFDKEPEVFGLNSGTQMLIRSIGEQRNWMMN